MLSFWVFATGLIGLDTLVPTQNQLFLSPIWLFSDVLWWWVYLNAYNIHGYLKYANLSLTVYLDENTYQARSAYIFEWWLMLLPVLVLFIGTLPFIVILSVLGLPIFVLIEYEKYYLQKQEDQARENAADLADGIS